MSVYGKNTKSIRKQDIAETRSNPIALDQIMFWHQAVQGETGINLGSLVMPPSVAATGNANPSPTLLVEQSLFRYKESIKIVSSLRGELTRGSFKISGNARIAFVGFTALENEYFECTISPAVRTGLKVIDAKVETARATLADGSTDAAIGFSTRTTKEEILVVRNGLVQTRNTNNSSTTQDGNYYVVDAGSGYGSVIRFNNAASGQDDDIFVTAVGNIIDPSSDSTFSALQVLQGQLDSVIPTLAELAGVPETDFQATPNDTDLKQFGSRVIEVENEKEDKFEIKRQTFSFSNPGGVTADGTKITVNNLEVGKEYQLIMVADIGSTDGSAVSITAVNGTTVGLVRYDNPGTVGAIVTSNTLFFTAATPTLVFNANNFGSSPNRFLFSLRAEVIQNPKIVTTTQWT